MKKGFKWILTLAAVFSAISLFAERESVLNPRDYTSWAGPYNWQFNRIDDYLTATGPVKIITVSSFMVYKDAEYELSGFFRTSLNQQDMTRFEFGFDPIDANGNLIPPESVCVVAGTDAVLAAPVNVGDTNIQVRGGNSNWAANGCIAFQASQNYADLPNRNTASYFSFGNDGEVMTLSLRNPMSRAYPAGTRVRNHSNTRLSVGYAYSNAPFVWTRFSTRIKGISLLGGTNNQWFPGTAQAKLFIIVPDNTPLDFRDINVMRITKY